MSSQMDRFDRYFPAPSPRQYQEKVIKTIVESFEEGYDVIVLDAPPGSGKSIDLYTALKMLDGDWFYATPLKVLQEQLTNDEFIGDDIIEIMGRSNYPCIHPEEDSGVSVDKAICQRDQDFECDIKDSCKYYGRKMEAINSEGVVVNMAYLMAEGNVPPEADYSLGDRDYVTVDECQSLDDWGLGQVELNINKYSVPKDIWKNIDMIDEDEAEKVDAVIEWVEEEIKPAVEAAIGMYSSIPSMSEGELDVIENLKDFAGRMDRFVADAKENDWVSEYNYEVRKNSDNYGTVKLQPVEIGRFLNGLLWRRGNKVILSSATVPKGDWIDEIGLSDRKVRRINVPSTFPVENRPIITNLTVGKMTWGEREDNIGKAVKTVKKIAEHHEGEKGIVHARGYNISKMFRRWASNHSDGDGEDDDNDYAEWARNNVHYQSRDRREADLEDWKDNDKQVFMSINMAEGIDLKGDLCRWQALLKVLYPHMQDERVKHKTRNIYKCRNCGYRLCPEDNNGEEVLIAECYGCGEEHECEMYSPADWDWYNRKAITQIEQAYGRAVRSRDDEAVFYILDESAIGLIQRNADLFHEWFLNGLDMKVRGQDKSKAYAWQTTN